MKKVLFILLRALFAATTAFSVGKAIDIHFFDFVAKTGKGRWQETKRTRILVQFILAIFLASVL